MSYRRSAKIEARERELASERLIKFFREQTDDELARLFTTSSSEEERQRFRDLLYSAHPDYDRLDQEEQDEALKPSLYSELDRRGDHFWSLYRSYKAVGKRSEGEDA